MWSKLHFNLRLTTTNPYWMDPCATFPRIHLDTVQRCSLLSNMRNVSLELDPAHSPQTEDTAGKKGLRSLAKTLQESDGARSLTLVLGLDRKRRNLVSHREAWMNYSFKQTIRTLKVKHVHIEVLDVEGTHLPEFGKL